jgi:hypothetical protein
MCASLSESSEHEDYSPSSSLLSAPLMRLERLTSMMRGVLLSYSSLPELALGSAAAEVCATQLMLAESPSTVPTAYLSEIFSELSNTLEGCSIGLSTTFLARRFLCLRVFIAGTSCFSGDSGESSSSEATATTRLLRLLPGLIAHSSPRRMLLISVAGGYSSFLRL